MSSSKAATNWKDWTIPKTEEELATCRKIFRSMPTYNSSLGTIKTVDIEDFSKKIGMKSSSEQSKSYARFYEIFFNGNLREDILINFLRVWHSTSKVFSAAVASVDLNNDGFIDPEEFNILVQIIVEHDPRHRKTLESYTYEDFVKESDTNKDNKVSVEEATRWSSKFLKHDALLY